jgi:hypothetical protein
MNDAQRYRVNAAECLSAAERCRTAYRDLTLAIADAWLSMAHQQEQEAIDELLAILSQTQAATATAPTWLPFRHHREPSRGRITAFQVRETISA